MANKKFLTGLLIIVLALGMTIIGCDNGTITYDSSIPKDDGISQTDDGITQIDDGNIITNASKLNGKWDSNGYINKYIFNCGKYELFYNGNPYNKGNYTITDDKLTMTIMYIGGYNFSLQIPSFEPSKWYSKDEVKAGYSNYRREKFRAETQYDYNAFVAAYGAASTNSFFMSNYGTINIDEIADLYMANPSIQSEINNMLNSWFPSTNTTVTYSINYDKLILNSTNYNRDVSEIFVSNHNFIWIPYETQHRYECICGEKGGLPPEYHVAGPEATCGAAQLCTVCDYEIAPKLDTHTPNWDNGLCEICNALIYNIGDIGPGGGRIFYIRTNDSSIYNYLEVAPSDSGYHMWSNAAAACASYENNGKTDWYLPNINDLQSLYDHKNQAGVTLSGTYWSSTEHKSNPSVLAWYVNFATGGSSFQEKYLSCFIRPIRSF